MSHNNNRMTTYLYDGQQKGNYLSLSKSVAHVNDAINVVIDLVTCLKHTDL